VVVCLDRGADLHMAQLMPLPLTVSCSSKIQIGFTFYLAYPGCPGKEAVKWLLLLLLLHIFTILNELYMYVYFVVENEAPIVNTAEQLAFRRPIIQLQSSVTRKRHG